MPVTPEELTEFLKDENNKSAFDTIVKTLGYETPDDIKGLKEKNWQLIAKEKESRHKLAEANKILDNLDMSEYNNYVESRKSAKGDNVDKDISRKLAKYEEALKQKDDYAKQIESELNQSTILTEFSKAFADVKINPIHATMLQRAFLGQARVEVTDGKRQVYVEDGDNIGVPVSEYFKKFVATDSGKAYVLQPENKGAGTSKMGSQSSKFMSISEFNAMGGKERAAFMANGGQVKE